MPPTPLRWACALLFGAASFSCSPAGTASNIITPTGGIVCLPDDLVCISIPSGALEAPITIKIQPTNEKPDGAFLQPWEINPYGLTFFKPATVTFKIAALFEPDSGVAFSEEAVANGTGVDPHKLRLFTRKDDGPWEPLGQNGPPLDRVRKTLSGTVEHLSPFAIFRTDRLADGGTP